MTSTTVTSVKRETAGIPDGPDQHPEFEQSDPCISSVLHNLYRMVVERIKGRMAEWSRAVQPEELTDDEGNHLPMPAAGLALWADATLVRSSQPCCCNNGGRTRD